MAADYASELLVVSFTQQNVQSRSVTGTPAPCRFAAELRVVCREAGVLRWSRWDDRIRRASDYQS